VVAPKTGAIGDRAAIGAPDPTPEDGCCSFELASSVSYAILKLC
jgi:hypothetical protein